jgi:hypothetical protein
VSHERDFVRLSRCCSPRRDREGIGITDIPSRDAAYSEGCNMGRRTLYFKSSLAIPFCCCKRILTTSKGVTMISASVIPALNPATSRLPSDSLPFCSRDISSHDADARTNHANIRTVQQEGISTKYSRQSSKRTASGSLKFHHFEDLLCIRKGY